MRSFIICTVILLSVCALSRADGQDDVVFIHHSVGGHWLNDGLEAALLAKDYIDERNDVYRGTDFPPDDGRPDTLGPGAATPGDNTDMYDWVPWFNDYLQSLKTHGCSTGVNRIIMFKSCYEPNSNVSSDGIEPGDPFSRERTLANYKAVYRHVNGGGNTYTLGGYPYQPLEEVFAQNPDTLFIPVAFPPRHYAPSDAATDEEAHRARVFSNWLKNEWLSSYNTANPGLHNVAVFDLFDALTYPDDHPDHPNRLRSEYGGERGDSHPNEQANLDLIQLFATGSGNFIDEAWAAFNGNPPIAPSDFDRDGDVDQEDFGIFQFCSTGPANGPPAAGCVDADLDGDHDVDLSDFGLFQRCFSGPDVPADPDCP